MHRHGRRIRGRHTFDQAHPAELADGARKDARVAHDPGCRSAHRSGLASCAGRRRGTGLRAELRSPSRGVRSGCGAGRSHNVHGTHRRWDAVPLLSAQEPLRAEFPCRPPSRPLPRRETNGVRDVDAGHDCRRHDRSTAGANQVQTCRGRRRNARRQHARRPHLSATWVRDEDKSSIAGEYNEVMNKISRKEYVYRSWLQRFWNKDMADAFILTMEKIRTVDRVLIRLNEGGDQKSDLEALHAAFRDLQAAADHLLAATT